MLLILAGVLAITDGVVTLLWQEPISALIAKLRQDDLNGQLRRSKRRRPRPPRSALWRVSPTSASGSHTSRRRCSAKPPTAARSGKITIPSIGARFVMVNGTDTSDLESGPGLYRGTTFPGLAGTTLIAGHRTTFLAPFRHIDALRPGQADQA